MVNYLSQEEKLLAAEEEKYLEEEDDVDFPPVDIIAYNEQRSCSDLVRMYQKKQLVIDPDFQRDVVWTDPQQTRFIDSLMKQLPIPSMCISLDYKTDKRYIIDGLQRISTIVKFLTTENWKLSKLADVDSSISGKTVEEIKTQHEELYERVENMTIPITMIRYDSSKKTHNNYIFNIFHRLNTGGVKLNNQEIRNCIYNGEFNTFLKECAQYENWLLLMDRKQKKASRFEDEELVLRFFAFYDGYQNYKGKLTGFLNDYMYKHRLAHEDFIQDKDELFKQTVDLIYDRIFKEEPLKTSKVIAEGILLGVAKNLDTLVNLSNDELQDKYSRLIKSEPFLTKNLSGGMYRKDKALERINTSIKIFSSTSTGNDY
ncbi:MAG: DUF262 domain-containing protein [Microcystis sp.]|jgi:hypothetical protein|uniref:DUF262 domain-containing protein n=1 Tax=unclassified Microcystis TaxID=2643300 RepID=UPI0022C0196E|nr:DUF262 domain-containing protein [Microcystis sp. 49638_E5]MCE2670464.1 DUF262 domain-containing protein [Microcystis sp. 49638_E5]MCZ8056397.1 DUF262 domain-containing protein [Microcystis sp. LE19-12.2C]MDJ0548282.1 DUF262 domain-containing protein [Microcystis sp. M49637_WE12]